MTLLRGALLERLVAKRAISDELRRKFLGWRHPGFSVRVGEPIPPTDTPAIEDVARHRTPLCAHDANRARGARAEERQFSPPEIERPPPQPALRGQPSSRGLSPGPRSSPSAHLAPGPRRS